MSWQDQGRQYHEWFGHGTAGGRASGAAGSHGGTPLDRARATLRGMVGALPANLRGRIASGQDHETIERQARTLAAWAGAARLGTASFARHFLGRAADDAAVAMARRVASGIALSGDPTQARAASEALAGLVRHVGPDRFAGFMRDAAERADAPDTYAAVRDANASPDPQREAVHPVYPVEEGLATLDGARMAGEAAMLTGRVSAQAGRAAVAAGREIGRKAVEVGEKAADAAQGELLAGIRHLRDYLPKSKAVRDRQSIPIHPGKQGKHIVSAKEYEPERRRSIMQEDANALMKTHAGHDKQVGEKPIGEPGSKGRFDTGNKVIGIYKNPKTGKELRTTRGIIHYGKGHAHIVPSEPRGYKK